MSVTLRLISEATERVAREIGLDDMDAQAAVELALEIVAGPRGDRIEGLSPAVSRIVQIVRAARGAIVPKDVICTAAKLASEKTIDVHLCKARKVRPDIIDCVVPVWGQGLCWREPGAPDPRIEPERGA